ncbi:MAG: tetratricopeptide repeat protein [Terriglobales bacterium]
MIKRFALTLTLFLAAAAWAAQTGSSSSSTPAQQPAATAPAQPQGPRQPQAKTQDELNEYVAIIQNADLAAAETAADGFATKFPESELTGHLYAALQRKYQGVNNTDKTVELGRKALKYLPDNPMALVSTATVIAERTRDSDLDRDESYAEAIKYAQHSLETIDTGLATGANLPPEQLQQIKNVLRSMAHAALGMVHLKKKDYPVAEEHFRKAADANPSQPDAYVFYRLSLTLDYQKKYAEALKAINRCLELAPADDPVVGLAKQEQSRLTKLVGTPAAPATPPSQPTPQTPPPSGK